MEFTKTSVLNRGISEYNFSYQASSDTEEEKNNCKIGDHSQNRGLIPWPLVVLEADPGALPNVLKK